MSLLRARTRSNRRAMLVRPRENAQPRALGQRCGCLTVHPHSLTRFARVCDRGVRTVRLTAAGRGLAVRPIRVTSEPRARSTDERSRRFGPHQLPVSPSPRKIHRQSAVPIGDFCVSAGQTPVAVGPPTSGSRGPFRPTGRPTPRFVAVAPQLQREIGENICRQGLASRQNAPARVSTVASCEWPRSGRR